MSLLKLAKTWFTIHPETWAKDIQDNGIRKWDKKKDEWIEIKPTKWSISGFCFDMKNSPTNLKWYWKAINALSDAGEKRGYRFFADFENKKETTLAMILEFLDEAIEIEKSL